MVSARLDLQELLAPDNLRFYDEAHMYAGDLHILREDKIIGVVEQLKFRRVPRMLMDRFFSPNKNAPAAHATSAPAAAVPAAKKQPATETIQPQPTKQEQKQDQLQLPNLAPAPVSATSSSSSSSSSSSPSPSSSGIATPTTEQDAPVTDTSAVTGVAGKCLELIANETGLGVAELTADATFVQLGVDSLMSLVLSEKLRSEMGLEIKSSLFLECPTVGDLTGWLEQYC
ncbi:putative PKS/NRPS-like protein biosynthetic cluster [Aspergillus brasiliensis]|nr:putative PKS/NRPS-like protein biosynthetic cluster [Aspergillus brasiliensis]